MTHKTFRTLFGQALEYSSADLFVAERGWQDWMDTEYPASGDASGDLGVDVDQIAADLRNIYNIAHMTPHELRDAAGLTQAKMSDRFCIPIRTIQNWDCGYRDCPDYLRLMMADLLGLVTVDRQG